MPNAKIGDFYRVNKSTHTPKVAKRNLESISPDWNKTSSKLKDPPYLRYKSLIENVAKDDSTNITSPTTTVSKPHVERKRRVLKCTNAKINKVTSQTDKKITGQTQIKVTSRIQNKATGQAQSIEQPKPTEKPLNCYQRFAYLAEKPDETPSINDAKSDSTTTPSKQLNLILKETVELSAVSKDIDLTQTESTIPPELVLPHHLRVILDLFRNCDTVVSMLHNRKELCSFDKLRPAVEEITRREFTEMHVAQFLTIYPNVYKLQYEKQIDKYTKKTNGNFVLVLTPNLREDGTQKGYDSPSKGFLTFSGTRLIQRRNRFHRILVSLIYKSHREFLINTLGIDSSKLPEDSSLRRWHPRFPLETAVPVIHPSPLPIKPDTNKITSAKDAVKVFQARALFREASVCTQLFCDSQKSPIPSPSKSSASSPYKPKSSSNIVESSKPVSNNLQGISKALIDKIRAKENERRLLTVLTSCAVSEARKAIYNRLPLIITQVWSILRPVTHPLPLTTVASRVADVYPGGLSVDTIVGHIDVLLEIVPWWIEKLSWSSAHLRLKDSEKPVKEVIGFVRDKVAKDGVHI